MCIVLGVDRYVVEPRAWFNYDTVKVSETIQVSKGKKRTTEGMANGNGVKRNKGKRKDGQ
jgi:hypothetical protein